MDFVQFPMANAVYVRPDMTTVTAASTAEIRSNIRLLNSQRARISFTTRFAPTRGAMEFEAADAAWSANANANPPTFDEFSRADRYRTVTTAI
jgi:hypothetical protein